jgi:hypothetical protein
MNQEVRPAAWVEDLPKRAADKVYTCLRAAGLISKGTKLGLEVLTTQPHGHLLVQAYGSSLTDEEAEEPFMEEVEQTLREAGYALIFLRRHTEEGWLEPAIQVYGKSAEGPGPRTVRQRVELKETPVVDLREI